VTLEGGFLLTRVRLERQAFCTKGSQYWCNASMLPFYMTVCRQLSARIEDCTYIFFLSFKFLELARAKNMFTVIINSAQWL